MFLQEIEILDESALQAIERIVILACGTSWHSGLVGKFLIEELARVPVEVDYGSEYRYREPIVIEEHARDRHHAVRRNGGHARRAARGQEEGRASIAICNVVGSMATRETDGTVYTHAGPEIGVASTKAFTSQIVALHLLAISLGQIRGTLDADRARVHIEGLDAAAARSSSRRCRGRAGFPRRSRERFYQRATSCTSGAASTTRSRSRAR